MTLGFNGQIQPVTSVPGSDPVRVAGDPGATVTQAADTTVGVGATVPLPVAPAGTRSMTVQVTVGNSLTNVRVRPVGGTAGAGRLLTYLGSTLYGGADGAITPMEVENVVGPSAQICTTFEGD